VARAVIEVEATIFIGRSRLILPYDSGNFVGVVASLGRNFFLKVCHSLFMVSF
jgi:hypothetical protein